MNILNFRKDQRTNQKYRNMVESDQQMQRLEETELRKADRTVTSWHCVKCFKEVWPGLHFFINFTAAAKFTSSKPRYKYFQIICLFCPQELF